MVVTDDKSDVPHSNDSDSLSPEDPGLLPPDYSEVTSTSTLSTHDQASPNFSEASGSTPPFALNFAPLAPPTNYLTIEKTNSSVKETYSIDPTLPVPPNAVKSKDKDGRDLNLRLFTLNGSVRAVVDLVRGADSKGPATLEVGSKNGSAHITMFDRRQNRFHLHAFSENGSVTVNIPPTFIGSIRSNLKHGSLKFHPAVKQRLTTFSELDGEGRYFIGDFSAHGYEDEETWHMDHLHVESKNGCVNINFTTNEVDATDGDKGRGFFNRLFRAG